MNKSHMYLFFKAKFAILAICLSLLCVQLLTAGDYTQDEPIWFTPEANLETIKKLLADTNGADVDQRNSLGQTGLMYAINIGRFGDFGRYDQSSDRSGLVETLIYYGADVNARSKTSPRQEDHTFDNTPLHFAAIIVNPRNSVDMIDYLVDAGAYINAKNNLGETPLMWSLQANQLETLTPIFKTFIADLADVNIQNNIGNTYLHLVIREKDAGWIQYLMQNFGSMFDLTLKNKEGWTPLEYAKNTLQPESVRAIEAFRPLGQGDQVNVRDELGRTGLMLAIIRNDLPFAERQIQYRAQVDAADTTRFKNTPLHFAVNKQYNMFPFVKLLLDNNNVNPNIENAYGETPLHYLVKYNIHSPERNKVAQELINAGADPNKKNKRGKSAIQMAMEKNPSFANNLKRWFSQRK
ncbi:MAG: ankyrin repeat domain-containing protein [Candidatus Dependentiae bacterium]